MSLKASRTIAQLLKILQAATFVLCTIGFVYGTVESWLKFASEPLSSTMTEINYAHEQMPSLTICRLELASYNKAAWKNQTLSEMKRELGMDFVLAMQGYANVLRSF